MFNNAQGESLNAKNLFARINFDEDQIKQMTYDREFLPYLEEFADIDAALALHMKGIHPHIKSRVRQNPMGPTVNRLAFPIVGGYSTFTQRPFYDFTTEFYNELLDEGVVETKLLIKHPLLFPVTVDFYAQPTYHITSDLLRDIDGCLPAITKLWEHNFDVIKLDECNIKAKKTTSPGWPFMTYDGQPYFNKDATYGSKADFADKKAQLRKNHNPMKMGHVEHTLPQLFDMVMDNVGKEITPDNAGFLMEKCVLTNNVNGYRLNSLDTVLHEGKYNNQRVAGKDRFFMQWGKDGFTVGTLNTMKLNEMTAHLFPSNMSPQRLRPINSSSFITGVIHQVHAKMFLVPIEDSKFVILSSAPQVVGSFEEYLTSVEQRKTFYVTSDRINAEVAITTNFAEFLRLVPLAHRPMFEMFMTHIKHTPHGPKMVKGLLSGVGWTTGFNVLVGLYEAWHQISVLTEHPIGEVSMAYVNSYINGESFTTIGEFKLKLFLPTDDIPLVINGPIKQQNIDKLIAESKSRMMDVEVNQEGFLTFGHEVNNSGVKKAAKSQYSKLFYHENPGYYWKDVFSTAARFSLVENTDLIDFLLKKHWGIGMSWYETNATKFLMDLKDLGISLGDVLNSYSPAEQIVISKYAGVDPVNSSQVVDPSYYSYIFDAFKSMS